MKNINTGKKIIVRLIRNKNLLKKELEKLQKQIAESPDFSGNTKTNPAKEVRYYSVNGETIEI